MGLIVALWCIVALAWRLEPEPRAAEASPVQTVEAVPLSIWEPIPEQEVPVAAAVESFEPEYAAYDDVPLPEDLQIFMQEKCDELDISYEFALALMETESSFDANAVGDGGNSIGRMQINKCNWQRMADDYGLDVADEFDNVAAGLVILRELFDQNPDPYYVILCYKAGIGRGAELYQQKAFQGSTYDCIAICEKAAEWERMHGK